MGMLHFFRHRYSYGKSQPVSEEVKYFWIFKTNYFKMHICQFLGAGPIESRHIWIGAIDFGTLLWTIGGVGAGIIFGFNGVCV